MKGFNLVDEIVPEPVGGAHWDYNQASAILKEYIIKALDEVKNIPPEERVQNRIVKFGKMGFWDEVEETPEPEEPRSAQPENAGS
jgi:acetyl-CoA carboxylase carboxyl transferase subunit alpha